MCILHAVLALLNRLRIALINWLLSETYFMAILAEVTQSLADATQALVDSNASIAALDLKIDEIRTFIAGLQVGVPVTQEQLDTLFTAVEAAKVLAVANKGGTEAALAETDALDQPA
mgnify:CR=1 FL=1